MAHIQVFGLHQFRCELSGLGGFGWSCQASRGFAWSCQATEGALASTLRPEYPGGCAYLAGDRDHQVAPRLQQPVLERSVPQQPARVGGRVLGAHLQAEVRATVQIFRTRAGRRCRCVVVVGAGLP